MRSLFLTFTAAFLLITAGPAYGAPDATHALARSLFNYDSAVPTRIEKGREETRGGLTYTWMTVLSVKDIPVPVMMIRDPGKAPKRILLVQHGNGSHKETEGLVFIAENLVKSKGYVSIHTDALYHGERTSPLVGKWGGGNLANQPNNVRDIFIQTVRDHRRALDAVRDHLKLNLPVDYMGESLGSLMGTVTVSVDPRIQRAIFLVGGADFLKINPMARAIKDLPSFRQVVDPLYWMGDISVPVLMLNGRLDPIIPPVAAKTLYQGLASKKKKQIWYDAGHGPDRNLMLKDILAWLKELDG